MHEYLGSQTSGSNKFECDPTFHSTGNIGLSKSRQAGRATHNADHMLMHQFLELNGQDKTRFTSENSKSAKDIKSEGHAHKRITKVEYKAMKKRQHLIHQ